MTPQLTIGMAHFDDFAGLFSTIQAIRLNNQDLMPQVEFVVVDNSAEDQQTGKAIVDLLQSMPDCCPSRYVAMPGNKGTSISRDAIFDAATGRYVLVLDCHVYLWPQALHKLLAHYEADPDSRDIISGPLLYDSLRNVSTHFDDQWSDAMWGTWGQAWKCTCGPEGVEFAMCEKDGKTAPRALKLGEHRVTACPACNRSIPKVDWAAHEQRIVAAGFSPLGFNDGPAFEIPGMGLGLFSCRREAWPHFNKHAIGFGGEELYIHEKFRQRGGKALCLPGLKWNHRFYRTGGAKYPNRNYWKARNYVLEFNELGLDLEPVRKHFTIDPVRADLPAIKTYLTPETWDALVSDPINNVDDIGELRAKIAMAAKSLPHLTTIEAVFDELRPITRDLNEHMDVFRALTQRTTDNGQRATVVEFTARRESTVAFLAGRPQSLISFTTEADTHCFKSAHLVSDTTTFSPRPYKMGEILQDLPDNDLLFIDTFHRYGQLLTELQAYAPKCRRFIVLHDTEIYGERGDDGGLGLRLAIAEFCSNNPQWAVIDHSKEQYGLTVLSCVLEDRPDTPVEGFNVPHGPGTELKKILTKLGINPGPSCGCNSKAAQMDIWGIDGCEQPENFQTIIGWLRDGTWSGLDLLGAVARSVFTGLAWEINPIHPWESLVKLCIKRAKENAPLTTDKQ